MGKVRGSGGSGNVFKGERKNYISWWNKNIITEYSKRKLIRQMDRLPALSGLARLFGEHIQVPYMAGLWLDEIEDGLDWRRAGGTYQGLKLNYPTFSWIAQPGPVYWPYIGNMRPYGKAFSVMKNDVKLATPDMFGRIESATLSLLGQRGTVGCQFAQEPDPQADFVDGILLNGDGTVIGDVEMDWLEYPTGLECFLLYKNSLGFLRVLMLKCVEPAIGQYQRIGVGQIHPNFAGQWMEGSRLCIVNLV